MRVPGDDAAATADDDAPTVETPPPMPGRADPRKSSRPTLPAREATDDEPPTSPRGRSTGRRKPKVTKPGSGIPDSRISSTPKIAPKAEDEDQVRPSGASLASALRRSQRRSGAHGLGATQQGIGAVSQPEPTTDEPPEEAQPGAAAGTQDVAEEHQSQHRETLPGTAPPQKVTMLPWSGQNTIDDDGIVQSFAPSERVQSIVDSATADSDARPDKPSTMLPGSLPAELRAELEDGLTDAPGEGDKGHRVPSGISVSGSGAYLPWKDAEPGTAPPPDPVIASLPTVDDVPSDEVEELDPEEVDSIDDIMAVDTFFADEKAKAKPTAAPAEASEPSIEVERQKAGARRWLPLVAVLLVLAGIGFWYQYQQTVQSTSAAPVAGQAEAAAEPAAGEPAAGASTAQPAKPEAAAAAGATGDPTTAPPTKEAAAGEQRREEHAAVAAAHHGPDEAPATGPAGDEGPPGDDHGETGAGTDTGRGAAAADDPPAAQPPPARPSVSEVPDTMVAIAKGVFPIGCTPAIDGCEADAMPAHDAALPAFAILKHEVTVAAYRECEAAGECPATGREPACNAMHLDRADHPVNCVSHTAAEAYCAWRGWRLPTETEWEAAARGRKRTRYPWGSQWPTCERTVLAVFEGAGCGDGHSRTVGSIDGDTSWAGARDLGGNVSEWVSDAYGPYPGAGPAAEFGDPSREADKLLRGGSFMQSARELVLVHQRRHAPANASRVDVGFRCAVAVVASAPAPVDTAAPSTDN